MTTSFSKILVANRGEIACRIMRTAQRMGIATVAVYSDADAKALHVAMADEAVNIGPAPVTDSYLRADKIIEAALHTGADAIHPGYGFLSENPGFVDAVTKAGLVFIGPSAEAIRAMGLKDAAKRLMEKAGVPVVPGYHGEAQELVVLASKAREIGYPVLIKARAGGGGKGMRKVDDPDDFAEALGSARREAKSAFGDDRVLVEKYIAKPRHIEVQVFGDNHGNVVHLFERDCSLQRRHQKVIEEAPAPGITDEMRAAMTGAAVKAARAISYSGAGTIEFIVDATEGLQPDRFWFMEMNTRLQVEHPVTEMVTGLDLVEWQLRVAAGEALPLSQAQIRLDGHAVEARLYAEDPARSFLPAVGTLHHIAFPEAAGSGAIRIETGVRSGDEISPFYDPMIAKIVVRAASRSEALATMSDALLHTEIAGTITNAGFLAALAAQADFVAGDVDTGLIDRNVDSLITRAAAPEGARELAILAASGLLEPAPGGDPWSDLRGYSNLGTQSYPVLLKTETGVERHNVRIIGGGIGGSGRTTIGGAGHFGMDGPDGTTELRVRRDGPHWHVVGRHVNMRAKTVAVPNGIAVLSGGTVASFALADPFLLAEEAAHAGDRLNAPMPGLVKSVRATSGDTVRKGQILLVLEAMKMEHTITAPHDGKILEIVAENTQVKENAALVRFAE
ncbi:acetyl/propionyl/methylcrotonyl-CoA carboxylase subunit alpha [Phyllobacterium sp. 21LDTY02-6]|uniref:acetyl/propionyl/methylcrotonyl-CoA carboxylase subunit alpha n=1 Tax=Phyllobacterium sp. 21LDTY02-6 TaxID=2944903 RepID=UPI00201FEE09|nr:acetyl/propionyl/methylcrotonyl-CoA carboxylase subunit alpha [Phyllobacterium sp. 21LDTY02-6]MCO4319851.1 acetyl/propionyl/methylcrotonyl-CoA carboxylase subunit alpha [Phyllobacterium sp. 21LDTY02-6]